MKKSIITVIALLLCFSIISYIKYEQHNNKSQEYCYKINQIIKDYNFFKGYVEKNAILLYDNENKIISKVDFHDFIKEIDIKYIRKDDYKIFFIFSGSIDDEKGIVFINDQKNSMLDGIYKLNRLGGNSYSYTTYP